MPKLTDADLVILSATARRDDGAALPLPKSLRIKGEAATRMLDGLLKKGLLDEKPAAHEAGAWRESKDGQRMMLVITDSGLKAIDGGSAAQPRKQSDPTGSRPKQPHPKPKTAGSRPKGQGAAPAVRQGTKQALLVDLLKSRSGATIDEAVAATGWQAHSVRGAISGTLKKKLGLAVTSEPVEKRGRVYRIAGRG